MRYAANRLVERCPSWPKEHDWKSCIRQKRIWGSNPHLSARNCRADLRVGVFALRGRCCLIAPPPHSDSAVFHVCVVVPASNCYYLSSRISNSAPPMRRGGRVVECGGLENRFTRNPGNEGSNPSSSARESVRAPAMEPFSYRIAPFFRTAFSRLRRCDAARGRCTLSYACVRGCALNSNSEPMHERGMRDSFLPPENKERPGVPSLYICIQTSSGIIGMTYRYLSLDSEKG